jgi:hypothetical protein
MNPKFNIQQQYALPKLYLRFVFIWEQRVTCATYCINWLVFVTETKSVYCAVRPGALNGVVCHPSLKGKGEAVQQVTVLGNLMQCDVSESLKHWSFLYRESNCITFGPQPSNCTTPASYLDIEFIIKVYELHKNYKYSHNMHCPF